MESSSLDPPVDLVVVEDDDDEDDEFEDALTDLGHLAVSDDTNAMSSDPFEDVGLPIFNGNCVEPEDLSQFPPFRRNVSSGAHNDDVLNSCASGASVEFESLGDDTLSNSDSGASAGLSDFNFNDFTSFSAQACEASTSSCQNLFNSPDHNTRSVSEVNSIESKENGISVDGSSEGHSEGFGSSEDGLCGPSVPSEEELELPSSSQLDDFTCDLPVPNDDVTIGDEAGGDDVTDEENDVTDTEEACSGIRPPVFEVDEEEERVRRLESQWTEEEKEERKLEANTLKSRGNQAFKSGEYDAAEDLYTQALSVCPTCFANDRSIIYSNRSACKLRKGDDEASLVDCTRALKLNPDYIKCLLRRAELYERCEKLDESLTDYKHVYELDRTIHIAAASIMRLEQMIQERNEKMKEEMLGQLKNLGNMILKPFGLSTNNFQLTQDPGSGGYSINFNR